MSNPYEIDLDSYVDGDVYGLIVHRCDYDGDDADTVDWSAVNRTVAYYLGRLLAHLLDLTTIRQVDIRLQADLDSEDPYIRIIVKDPPGAWVHQRVYDQVKAKLEQVLT
jgi:hypothetical protein